MLPGSVPAVPRNSEAADVVVGGRTVGRVVTGRRPGSGDGLNTQLKSRLGERLVEAGVLAGVLALMLALIVALRMARPLHRLTDVARRMAHGEIETRAVGSGGPRETTELARTLDRLAAALRRQDELRRATVADIVHELRNTLVGVVGRIEALQDGMVADEQTALERTAARRAPPQPAGGRRAAARGGPEARACSSASARSTSRRSPRSAGPPSRTGSPTAASSSRAVPCRRGWRATPSGWRRSSTTCSPTPCATRIRAER